MPQVDLSPLFTPPPKDRGPRPDPFRSPSWNEPQAKSPARFRISLSQVTNVGFVLAACLGAVVSTLYFIKGGELLQDVAAWPRELFNGRPVASRASTITSPIQYSKDDAGDPFSPVSRLLSLNLPVSNGSQPNGPTSTAPLTNAPFNRLSMPAPGGDALSRSLMEAGPASAQSATSNAQAIGQAATSRLQQQSAPVAKAVTGRAKTARSRTHATGGKVKSKGVSASTRLNSRSRGRSANTSSGGITVAEPGSHIGSLSAPTGQSPGLVGSTAGMNRANRAGAGAGMNSIRGTRGLGGH